MVMENTPGPKVEFMQAISKMTRSTVKASGPTPPATHMRVGSPRKSIMGMGNTHGLMELLEKDLGSTVRNMVSSDTKREMAR